MYGYIYLATNLIDGKKYIGQHKYDKPEIDQNYTGSGTILKKAIKKYGIENFSFEILNSINNVPTICESLEDLNNSEYYYTKYYNVVESSDYYNLMEGGNQGGFSKDVRLVMSQKALNRDHPATTAGRICVNNGLQNKLIPLEKLDQYRNLGYIYDGQIKKPGRKAWNSNKTQQSDPRIKQYTESRNQHFKNGESIGFCKYKDGKYMKNGISDDYLQTCLDNGFIEYLNIYGKTKACKQFNIPRSQSDAYDRLINLSKNNNNN